MTINIKSLTSTVVLSCFLSGIIVGYATYYYGSFPGAMAAMRGEGIFVDQGTQTFICDGHAESFNIFYKLTNLTSNPVRIIGSRTSCSCAIIDRLPPSIAPFGVVAIRAKIDMPKDKPSVKGEIDLFTDDNKSQRIRLEYTGRLAVQADN